MISVGQPKTIFCQNWRGAKANYVRNWCGLERRKNPATHRASGNGLTVSNPIELAIDSCCEL